jgi:hypothetical protein
LNHSPLNWPDWNRSLSDTVQLTKTGSPAFLSGPHHVRHRAVSVFALDLYDVTLYQLLGACEEGTVIIVFEGDPR